MTTARLWLGVLCKKKEETKVITLKSTNFLPLKSKDKEYSFFFRKCRRIRVNAATKTFRRGWKFSIATWPLVKNFARKEKREQEREK